MAKYEKDRLSEEAIDNKRRYDNEYLRENYKNFVVHIPKEECENYDEIIKQYGLSRVQFIRLVFKMINNGKINLKEIKKED